MKSLILILSFALSSCSFTKRNLVQRDEFEIYGGSAHGKSWDDSLTLKRASWYLEMTMAFDLLVTEIDDSSEFFNWFSTSEKVAINKCKKSYLAIYYSNDNDYISKKDFLANVKKRGLDEIVVNGFVSAFRLHHQYVLNSFKLYKTSVLCSRDTTHKEFIIEFANYPSVKM
ncbi:hypothetical protein A9Q84_08275 [Halobacteriovorax marinus]|uniref:Lipoprotein n=1 Tax=Halobacteriovorax marinus TaxID=97084 RepID=A0A1Y5FCI4_9BACT|nr:hypothetical protein A9Q84_08275 [Halobacteriovorax marinus]